MNSLVENAGPLVGAFVLVLGALLAIWVIRHGRLDKWQILGLTFTRKQEPPGSAESTAISPDLDPTPAATVEGTNPRQLPALVWKVRIARQAWKNSPVVVGDSVFVGAAGEHWNEPDSADGTYCIDATTGAVRWFAHTPADANRLLVSRGFVVTGCDDGSVVGISAHDGRILWTTRLPGGVVGGPIKLPGAGSPPGPGREVMDPILLTTYVGGIHLLDLGTGREIQHLALGCEMSATPGLLSTKHQNLLVLPALNGEVFFVEYDEITVRLKVARTRLISCASKYDPSGHLVPALATEPAVTHDGLVILGFARDTSYDEPPLVCVDAQTGAIRWLASDPEHRGGGFGNLRGRPVIIDREVIFATAYSNKVCGLCLDDGRLRWAVELGQEIFEQWSGPVAVGRSVYLGRHDGYLHKVDSVKREREWSLYLGNSARAGMVVAEGQQLPEFNESAAWVGGQSAPILATPVYDRGRLYVGTFEGYLYCIGGLGDTGSTSPQASKELVLDAGFLSPYFATEDDDETCVLNDVYVLVYAGVISGTRDVLPVLESVARSGSPLLIVAQDVSGEALSTLIGNKQRGTIASCAVGLGATDNAPKLRRAIARFTGATVLGDEAGLTLHAATITDLGRATVVVSRARQTQLRRS